MFHEVYVVSSSLFDVGRLAGQTTSKAVSLFLDGDVSFLPDNSFPSNIQLLKVCVSVCIWVCVYEFHILILQHCFSFVSE